jgi:tryptophan-rich sensory protein
VSPARCRVSDSGSAETLVGWLRRTEQPLSYTTTQRKAANRRPRIDAGAIGVLIAFLAIAYAVAAFGAFTTIGAVNGWYSRSAHVVWTPPNAAFGPVWAVLYTMIAVAGWLVWQHRTRRRAPVALPLFVIQLVLNSLWTPIFFGGYSLIGPVALWIALAVILLLDLAVAATIAAFWPVSRVAALLLVPYLVWILYASTLNWGDAALNALG